MKALRIVLDELVGLFVDDWLFTAAVLAWVAVAVWLLPVGSWSGPLLFAGCLAVLMLFVWRRARQPAGRR
ncbi:MAG: hypothetical protein U1E45_23885 [Geminicoccaceae bacterium]